MNENEKPLSDKVTEWTARQLSHEAYDRFMQGGWDAEEFVPTVIAWAKKEVAAALRLAEHPTPSPDATEAARAMREACAAHLDETASHHTACVGDGGDEWHRRAANLLAVTAVRLRAFPLPTPQPDERDEALRVATQAARDVLVERERQKSDEGWTPDHDDENQPGDMSCAAACYALTGRNYLHNDAKLLRFWPWSSKWWKPTDQRRDLVKAGALILAEIERIDRATLAAAKSKGGEG